jgi:hypothetical protein
MDRHVVRGLRGVLIGQLAAGICVLFLFAPETAHAYSCGDPSEGHCYGTASWQEQPQYFGAYTDILQAPMDCPSGCGGFVNDEIWLVDTQTAECVANPFKMCWVEAGYWFVEGATGKQFFWADGRPTNTNTLNVRFLGPTDQDGVIDHFMIIKDGRGEPGIFQVWVYNTSLSTLYNGTSTSNAMSGNRIDIGQELAGSPASPSNNAFAGQANFSRNIWAVQVLGPEYVFWYNSQTDTGSVTSDNPPFGVWTLPPLSTGAPEGGQFTTRCCN